MRDHDEREIEYTLKEVSEYRGSIDRLWEKTGGRLTGQRPWWQKPRTWVWLSVAAACLILTIRLWGLPATGLYGEYTGPDSSDSDLTGIITDPGDLSGLDSGNACYLGVRSIEEMKEMATAIVIGRVIDYRSAGEFGTIAVVEVREALKGEPAPVIEILQLKSDYRSILGFNCEYILFLIGGEDSPYAVVGGCQGAFLKGDGKLINIDPIMKEELARLVRESPLKSEFAVLKEFARK